MSARIVHIQGNFIRMMLPLGVETVSSNDGATSRSVEEFIPSSDYPVRVILSHGVTKRTFEPTAVNGNIVTIEDNGSLPVGAYCIEVLCRDDAGRPMRFRKETVLEVVNETAEGATIDTDELDAVTYYPVLKARECGVLIGEDSVTLVEGVSFGGDPDYTDQYAEISAHLGDGAIEVTDNAVILTI